MTIAWVAAAEAGEIEQFTLRNGLSVALAPDARAPVVVTNLTFDVGAGQDPMGHEGLAHLFEHLAFQGTVSSPQHLFSVVEPLGGTTNGATGMDFTNYWLQFAPSTCPPRCSSPPRRSGGWRRRSARKRSGASSASCTTSCGPGTRRRPTDR